MQHHMNNKMNQSRISFNKLGEIYPPAKNVTVDIEVIENIDCYWFRYKEESKNALREIKEFITG
jgi:hypothetical protein